MFGIRRIKTTFIIGDSMRTKLPLILLLFISSSVIRAQIDQEANQQAKIFWNSRITKCGDDFYTKDRNYIHQFRNPRIEVKASSLSSADRANGIQYIGYTSYKTELSRTYSPKQTLYQDTGWSKWSNGFTMAMGGVGLDATLRKENGRWSVTPSSWSQAVVLKPVDCSNLLGSSDNQNKDSLLTNLPPILNFYDSNILAALKSYGLIMVCNPNPIPTQEKPKSLPKSNNGVDVRTEIIVPIVDEIGDGCEKGKPNPFSLVVEIAMNGNLTLNNEKQGNILGQNTLLEVLNKIFRSRKDNGVYRVGTNDIENTVTIKVPTTINRDIFIKTLKLITSSGSSPITLYVEK